MQWGFEQVLQSTTPRTRIAEAILNVVLFFSFVMLGDREVATLAAPIFNLAMASLFLAIHKSDSFKDG